MPEKQSVSQERFLQPTKNLQESLQGIYERNKIKIGPDGRQKKLIHPDVRRNTFAVVGGALGDEGKGRFVDNLNETLLEKRGIDKIWTVRFQGGNNAGHTIEKDGQVLKLHLIPSGVFYDDAIGIIDTGVVVHPEDLVTEINYVEDAVGNITNRLILSESAILVTDLERAEEKLNNARAGKSRGGTGRGIGPAYAHHLDRRGNLIRDLLSGGWKKTFADKYDQYEKDFAAYGLSLEEIEVPDYAATLKTGVEQKRAVGGKIKFLKRLENARSWVLDAEITQNTLPLHHTIFEDRRHAVVFEGAQAAGLDAWVGTRPDVTSSNTRSYGISEGTRFWKRENLEEVIAVIKVPYTSSVGSRRMPTHVDLPKDKGGLPLPLPENATYEQKWAEWVREEAHEYGTTTGRARDINHLDLEFIRYSLRMSGADSVAVTHLDVAREEDVIKVCTHYEDEGGQTVFYEPDLERLRTVIPSYVELPGWDGQKAQSAKKAKDLPDNSRKFLAFLQDRLGYPIVAATTGPSRENFVSFRKS